LQVPGKFGVHFFSPVNDHYITLVDHQLEMYDFATGEQVLVLESPTRGLPPDLDSLVKEIQIGHLFSEAEAGSFSPDGREFAILTDDFELRILCWNSAGQLVFDELISSGGNRGINDPRLQWLPGRRGWIFNGVLYDRASKRIVMQLGNRFTLKKTLLIRLVAGDRLLAANVPRMRKQLEFFDIPWQSIDTSLRMIERREPAILTPSRPVSLQLDFAGVQDSGATARFIREKMTKRLAADGLQVASGAGTRFCLRFSEKTVLLPIHTRAAPYSDRVYDTGRKQTIIAGSLVIELVSGGQILWRDSVSASGGSSCHAALNDPRLRDDMLRGLERRIAEMYVPYFVPKSEAAVPLPLVIE
jgi:hypothetical protein